MRRIIGIDRATKNGEYTCKIWAHWTKKGALVIDKMRRWKPKNPKARRLFHNEEGA